MKQIVNILILGFMVLTTRYAMADGMIVPIRPELPVQGSWAVKYHHVDIAVRDQVASVTIDQEFLNTGSGMIEVEYLFPVPPDAAIDSMTLLVNGKEFTAKLLKADEARKIYEDIVRRKKDPALLEYAGFGLYRTRAFPLEPNKPCRVAVSYKTVCKMDAGVAEVWYPLNTEKYSAKPIEDVQVRVDIKHAGDIATVYSPSHEVKLDRKSNDHIIATYHEKKVLPVTDFVLYYKPAKEPVGATLLTHQGDPKEDGYFMLLVNPHPGAAKTEVVAKDVVFVLDRSGSMSGKRIQQAKEALSFILKNLNPEDQFNIVVYSDSVEPMFESLVPADKQHVSKASETVDRIDASGGTNIHKALSTAMSLISNGSAAETGRPKYVIFLTDGLATVGKTDEKTILADTLAANKSKARLFALGVGYNVNIRLLDKLVLENRGRSDYVKESEPAEAKVAAMYRKIKNPVMTELSLSVEGVKLRDMYPRDLGDLFEGDQILVVGRYDARDVARFFIKKGVGIQARFLIKGMFQGKPRTFEYDVNFAEPGKDLRYAFVEKLWAVRRIGYLLDQIQLVGQNKELIDELVRISMKYGIVTPYTSFLADETTALEDREGLKKKVEVKADMLGRTKTGGAAQVAAKNRQMLNLAKRVAPSGPAPQVMGSQSVEEYERGDVQTVANVRQVGNQAIYRRGQLWKMADLVDIDLKRDAAKIQIVKRFSDEYFRLIQANTAEENQILAGQAKGEQLLVRLRGQIYLIE